MGGCPQAAAFGSGLKMGDLPWIGPTSFRREPRGCASTRASTAMQDGDAADMIYDVPTFLSILRSP